MSHPQSHPQPLPTPIRLLLTSLDRSTLAYCLSFLTCHDSHTCAARTCRSLQHAADDPIAWQFSRCTIPTKAESASSVASPSSSPAAILSIPRVHHRYIRSLFLRASPTHYTNPSDLSDFSRLTELKMQGFFSVADGTIYGLLPLPDPVDTAEADVKLMNKEASSSLSLLLKSPHPHLSPLLSLHIDRSVAFLARPSKSSYLLSHPRLASLTSLVWLLPSNLEHFERFTELRQLEFEAPYVGKNDPPLRAQLDRLFTSLSHLQSLSLHLRLDYRTWSIPTLPVGLKFLHLTIICEELADLPPVRTPAEPLRRGASVLELILASCTHPEFECTLTKDNRGPPIVKLTDDVSLVKARAERQLDVVSVRMIRSVVEHVELKKFMKQETKEVKKEDASSTPATTTLSASFITNSLAATSSSSSSSSSATTSTLITAVATNYSPTPCLLLDLPPLSFTSLTSLTIDWNSHTLHFPTWLQSLPNTLLHLKLRLPEFTSLNQDITRAVQPQLWIGVARQTQLKKLEVVTETNHTSAPHNILLDYGISILANHASLTEVHLTALAATKNEPMLDSFFPGRGGFGKETGKMLGKLPKLHTLICACADLMGVDVMKVIVEGSSSLKVLKCRDQAVNIQHDRPETQGAHVSLAKLLQKHESHLEYVEINGCSPASIVAFPRESALKKAARTVLRTINPFQTPYSFMRANGI